MKFLDRAKIYVQSGKGGNGCLSFRREKFIQFGGPNGGDGGRGGHVFALAVDNLNTLIDFRYQQHYKAAPGRPGEGSNRTGADGDDKIILIPVGTQIFEEDEETLIADLHEVGQKVLLARGGNGGFGNARFKSATNRAPRRANPGHEGENRTIWLRLKLIADIGLVGLPNAGKSTLLGAASAAKPKIADYPFTTLHPGLGVVRLDNGASFVLADIPGLIEGAHEGAGIGDRFLGHVERCAAIIHLVDGAHEDVVATYDTIRRELEAYGHDLAQKNEFIALTKADIVDVDEMAEKKTLLEAHTGQEVAVISAVTGENLRPLLGKLHKTAVAAREEIAAQEAQEKFASDTPDATPDSWAPAITR